VTDAVAGTLSPSLDDGTAHELSRRKREPAFLLRWRPAARGRGCALPPFALPWNRSRMSDAVLLPPGL